MVKPVNRMIIGKQEFKGVVRGSYVNFFLHGGERPVDVEEFNGNCVWDKSRMLWCCSMTLAAYANWVLKKEFGRGDPNDP